MLAVVVATCSCAGPRSTFDFDLTGDLTERVSSSGSGATGEIDNAGHLALDDGAWGLAIGLPSISPGTYPLGTGGGRLAITSKATGDVFTTTPSGSCSVTVNPHASSNGSTVSGAFECTGLTSFDGARRVDVTAGSFQTLIDDAANNPSPP